MIKNNPVSVKAALTNLLVSLHALVYKIVSCTSNHYNATSCKCMMVIIGKNGCNTEYMFICIFNQLFILESVIYGEMERMFTTQEKGASIAARTMDFGSL